MTRQMGVNMPNLLHLYLGSGPGGAAAARAQMDEARALGITHARFIASGYWPIEMKTGNGWQVNPTAYFAAFDQLVDDAETRGLRLVPSRLFNLWLFPDMAQEPMGKLFTPGSATRTLAEAYLTDVVNRYKGRATISFWELGNEANLLADLDMSSCNICGTNTNNCGSLAPSLQTPCMRTTADNFFSCNSCRGVSATQQDLGAFTQSIPDQRLDLVPAPAEQHPGVLGSLQLPGRLRHHPVWLRAGRAGVDARGGAELGGQLDRAPDGVRQRQRRAVGPRARGS